MNAPARRIRPAVERVVPDRTWPGTFGKRPSEAVADSPAQEQPAETDPPAQAPRTAVYETLNDAYRLVDEYMRQGQRMAENLWLPLEGAGENPFNAPERFMRAMSDMTLAWVEVMQQWTTGVKSTPRQAPVGSAGPFSAGFAPQPTGDRSSIPPVAPATQGSLSVCVQARGRVEVSVHVGDLTDLGALVPSELRPFSGKGEPIREVRLELRADEPATLRIVVPEGQPSGTYNGLLLERVTQRPRGTLSLTLSEG
jgi:hypothetical protein